ncbi:hypothetical protein SASPL_150930 [Salvia splendens]|uniref:Uncharacterized protein n=1 Tax=Salvia splendens TaxID=180675 RepID=A0A8X8Z398_SALSN|nr:hypothetical protein SASPL_150930 [Salvia splendens]
MSSIGQNANPVHWMNRMVSESYYLLHCLAFFSYIPVRCAAAQVLSSRSSAHLLHREIQAFLSFGVLAAIKVVRTESWEAFISDTLFYAKIFLAAIALVLDYHLALWYAIAFLGASSPLTPLQLETVLTEVNTSKFWMVGVFSLSLSPTTCNGSTTMVLCRWNFVLCLLPVAFEQAPLFLNSRLREFSNKNLSFVTVDLGLFPNAAEKFGISLGSLHQLPAYVLFHDGTGIIRLPETDYEAKFFEAPVSKHVFSEVEYTMSLILYPTVLLIIILVEPLLQKFLCRHFGLDKMLLDYINGK